jgi:hypothetical protein
LFFELIKLFAPWLLASKALAVLLPCCNTI